ncbi:hypothetical protein [Cohnella sp. GbtcB17]|uniref:hypothetical protein n=1 Tax=Cohnella sp. GbtcB17 TaxID=2824762 RepID=UPI001C2F9850|nr:hypothetical protein [Cohnella sp. GbtcB17]
MLNQDRLAEPSAVFARTESEWVRLLPTRAGTWEGSGIKVDFRHGEAAVGVVLEAPGEAIMSVKVRWNQRSDKPLRILGDAWERAYGDLEWRGLVPERAMPWYFLADDGTRTAGCGVKTGASAFCCWQADIDGVTFTADVASGSEGVLLGARSLTIAEFVAQRGREGETPFAFARRFCRMLCASPRLPKQPVYGGNNWYYAYGNSSHEEILADSRFISLLASHPANRPYMVIDDGWQLASGGGACNGGPWTGNDRFPDMARLAGEMKAIGVKPGLWCRPLLTAENVPAEWIRYEANGGRVLDPTVPEVLSYIGEAVGAMRAWGFELLKHDFTTYDLLGQWGFTMKSRPSAASPRFRDRSRTTAEIVLALYRTIAEASGEADIIGCNTIGHLAAGLFEIQRTGDDTSGKWWERTRYMGINTLAFRMPQHDTFFSHDADCIGLTPDVPWQQNRHWLRLLALSGTPLFVSARPSAVAPEQAAALRKAFDQAAVAREPAEPLDWQSTTCPSRWLLDGEETVFDWNELSAQTLDDKDNGWWL